MVGIRPVTVIASGRVIRSLLDEIGAELKDTDEYVVEIRLEKFEPASDGKGSSVEELPIRTWTVQRT